jgi:predicted CXXCH cytochrome family protein
MARKAAGFMGIAMALLLVAVVCPPVEASILNTAHETSIGTSGSGVCSACHIPHGAAGARLWPVSPVAGTKVGVVAQLCGSCHHSGEGYNAVMSAAFSDTYVYGTVSHGQLMHTNNLPWSTVLGTTATGFPYTDCTVAMECTSCHNVHDDTNRPFLRQNINVVCAYCHTNRHYKNGVHSSGASGGGTAAGTWGSGFVGDNNVGSHPVGTDITGDVYGAASLIYLPVRTKVQPSGTPAQWSLGGHLTGGSSGGVTCVTCHAVHGVEKDVADSGNSGLDNAVPVANFLVYAQNAVTGSWTNPGGGSQRSVANGDTQYNALCEACHGRNADGTPNKPGNYNSSIYAPNPGGTGKYSHPIDDYPATYDAGVSAFPTNWPVGGGMTAGTNVNPIPICESCHVPHPVAERYATGFTPRADVDNNAKEYILRAPHKEATTGTTGVFCNRCHSATFNGHHPTNKSYNSAGVSYLYNTTGAAGDLLVCSTCHSSSGAHNWAAQGQIGLASTWKPANNGRDNTVATYMYNAQTSITCMDCHYGMDGNAASKSPTMGASSTVRAGETEFDMVNQSNGTHFIGLIYDNNTNWKGTGAISFEDPTSNWRSMLSISTGLVGVNARSRFGGTNDNGARVLVCESCHNLKPSWNVGGGLGAHLLLASYTEGRNGDDNTAGVSDSNGRDILCEACHGFPPGTHAVTGETVSRTGAVLSTTNTTWLRSARVGQATWGTNKISCDSCHQPHDANTNSYTFILDAPVDNVGAAKPFATQRTTSTYTATYITERQQGKGGDYTQFCNQCHLY